METALYDVSEEQFEKAKPAAELAATVLERLEAAQEDGGSLRFETDLAAALEGAEFVIEAVPEKLELKHEVFAQFEQLVPAEAILASNTSGFRSRRSRSLRSIQNGSSACTGRTRRT